MLRRLHLEQPDSFAFTPENQAWAEKQLTKYPEGREASAIIPLLWRAQEQEGWLTRPAIETVASMLNLAYMRALEVASFYFMFQLQPVGSVAHIQVCGTTSCMICGAEDLVAVCQEKIAQNPHELSSDGKFSWEEVECLGSCANAPMAQIGKDYYEDLTAVRMGEIIDELAAGQVPTPGPQNGRYASEPLKGLTTLTEFDAGKHQYNASVQLASDIGDTVKRIDGTEVPLLAPWGQAAPTTNAPVQVTGAPANQQKPVAKRPAVKKAVGDKTPGATPSKNKPASKDGITKQEANADSAAKPRGKSNPPASASASAEKKPRTLSAPRKAGADDLKRISGVGPKLEGVLNELGFWHFDQIAKWTDAEVAWVDSRLKFKGRIERDNWIDQAAKLAAEG
ncbi:NADH-quinone oxidoreductase subunit E [Pseudooctadecabacter jejudonensis]|uniref:NADH-quinone oxidoreductase chain 2 n=1 Tax=Pseudooctadecabacter jejudonensis TaxID=1391910 RepID=A0A1Y5T8T5_9RHOB|nr:NADH-quinone oxidoreductase subunit E [Pseudooctadecabacter jejudonensis]SLN58365.1 NADH-quinone oxidoreductase chain 2 [Pseudooctadecabacter jejudonensis]